MRKLALFVAAAFLVAAVPISEASAAPKPPIVGTEDCDLTGTASIKPGLPLTSSGPAAKRIRTSVKFAGDLDNCTGDNNASPVITNGTLKAKSVVITDPGEDSPSCTGLAAPDPEAEPIVLKSTIKWQNFETLPNGRIKKKTLGTSKVDLTLGTPSLGPPITFDLSGVITKGPFTGETVNVHAVLDQDTNAFLTACSSEDGLTTMSFTGAQGTSTLSVDPAVGT